VAQRLVEEKNPPAGRTRARPKATALLAGRRTAGAADAPAALSSWSTGHVRNPSLDFRDFVRAPNGSRRTDRSCKLSRGCGAPVMCGIERRALNTIATSRRRGGGRWTTRCQCGPRRW